MTIIFGGTPFSSYPEPATPPATASTKALLAGRAAAEAEMIAEGVVRRANGTVSMDQVTLVETPNFDTIYVGLCKLKGANSVPSVGAIPGTVVVSQNAELHFPVDGTAQIQPNDIWECVSNPLDPGMVGTRVRIAGTHNASFATARRLPIVATP